MSEQALETHLDGQEQRPPEKMVTVEKSYLKRLKERDEFLCALEQAGVDNWSGYSYAFEILEESSVASRDSTER